MQTLHLVRMLRRECYRVVACRYHEYDNAVVEMFRREDAEVGLQEIRNDLEGDMYINTSGRLKILNPFSGGCGDGKNAILLQENGPVSSLPFERVRDAVTHVLSEKGK